MDFLDTIASRAAALRGRVVLAEGHDGRIVDAAKELATRGLAHVTVLCPGADRHEAHEELHELGVDVRDPATDESREALMEHLLARRGAKGLTRDAAESAVSDPLYFASLLVATGKADASVGGAVRTTADTVRAALHCIGPGEGLRTVSSAFVMVHPDPQWGDDGLMVFSDCAVMPDPTSDQLAEIAASAAATFRSIVGREPRVALLSFSTKKSASHALVDKVTAACEALERRGVDFEFDGELQLDAAVIPAIGGRKAPGSAVAGRANVLVFPDLNAGNITYKAVERFGGALALGPLMQGLAKPANDLSRGCSAADVVQTSLLSLLQARG